MNNIKIRICSARGCYERISATNKSELCQVCAKKQRQKKASKKKVIEKETGINTGKSYKDYLKADKFVGVPKIEKI